MLRQRGQNCSGNPAHFTHMPLYVSGMEELPRIPSYEQFFPRRESRSVAGIPDHCRGYDNELRENSEKVIVKSGIKT